MYTLETAFSDIIVLLFLVLCLIGLKPVRRPAEAQGDGTYLNPGYLSPALCNMWRGIMALTVIIHHVAQVYSGEGILLSRFAFAGELAVAVFFFFSGYGLQKSYMSKPDYNRHFLLRRLPSVVFPAIIAAVLAWIVFAVLNKQVSPMYVLSSVWTGSGPLAPLWYIAVILFFYLVYKLLMVISGKHYTVMVILACAAYAVWAVLCLVLRRESCWFNAAHLFAVGIFWAVNEKKLTAFLRKAYVVAAPIVWTLCVVLLCGSEFVRSMSGLDGMKGTLLRGALSLITTLFFTLSVVLLNMKLTVGNAVLGWLGARSLEIYLVQGIFLVGFGGGSLHIENHPLRLAAVLACSVALGAVLHPLNKAILSGWKKLVK